jgi:hypothetical protein
VSDLPNVTIILHDFSKLSKSLTRQVDPRVGIIFDFVASNIIKSETTVKPRLQPPPIRTTASPVFPKLPPSITSTPAPQTYPVLSLFKSLLDNPLLDGVRELTGKIVGSMIKLIPSG